MGNKQRAFKYGYKYQVEPFKDYEDYTIAIPLEETNKQSFGNCYLMTSKGKKCPYFVKGIAPLNIEICGKASKINESTMNKLFSV
jgi:hypothetical protein